ncbi:MAG: N-succinylarginine dihydrolase [Thermodesulfobacteriota bacterium]
MADVAFEVNFDGLVGPSHNYGGLSYGNIAAMRSRFSVSHPRAALIEGLHKMRVLVSLGLKQAVLPPQARPDFRLLRRLGYSGNEAAVLEKVAHDDPVLLHACWSASSMWAANAATVSPSADTADGRIHVTPANLVTQFHRAIEPPFTAKVLRKILPAAVHHEPLPGTLQLGDEGAANHTRLATSYHDPGIELFVYGRSAFDPDKPRPTIFPGRQTFEASAAVARLHQLDPRRIVFAQQNPRAIDEGVFHNDVISVGDRNVFLYHTEAFCDTKSVVRELREKFADLGTGELVLVPVTAEQVSVTDAVESYLFNSQLVALPDGNSCLVAPRECETHAGIRAVLDDILEGKNPIRQVLFVDVRQSMKNGGGPACLRLRVVLTERLGAATRNRVDLPRSACSPRAGQVDSTHMHTPHFGEERTAMDPATEADFDDKSSRPVNDSNSRSAESELATAHQGVFLTDELYARLLAWGERHYRESLWLDDLVDPLLVEECRSALDSLTEILGLGSMYDFQLLGEDKPQRHQDTKKSVGRPRHQGDRD